MVFIKARKWLVFFIQKRIKCVEETAGSVCDSFDLWSHTSRFLPKSRKCSE